jgi:hypothetical protein
MNIAAYETNGSAATKWNLLFQYMYRYYEMNVERKLMETCVA